MDYSSSSSSSYASTSITRPPSYATQSSSLPGSRWNAPSNVSSYTAESTTSIGQLRPLDLGPPGYQATITLCEGTADEKTVYLGPWEVVGSENRRILWQGSYQVERLEHFLPSSVPSDIIPNTLHALHRRFSDPYQLEHYVTFRDRHRIRYTNEDGTVAFDRSVEVKYDFTSIESSWRFQGDLRRKDLVDCFDVDVVWTDMQNRQDSFGKIKGLGTAQRLKVWSDQYNTSHSITVFANKLDQRYKEFYIENFDEAIRTRDDRKRHVKLTIRDSRRGSASASRGMGLSAAFGRRRRSTHGSSSGASSGGGRSLDIRYLGIQFSRDEDYHRFFGTWATAHGSEGEIRGVAYPHERFELPSPEMDPNTPSAYTTANYYTEMQTVPESMDSDDPNSW